MRTIASLAAASLIAATSLASTTVTADAGGKHWNGGGGYGYSKQHYYKHRHNNNGWNPGAALATGAILGLAIGSMATPHYYAPPPPPVYYAPPAPPPGYYYGGPTAQHVSWCEGRYRSYDARYNTWVDYDGFVHQCVSPF